MEQDRSSSNRLFQRHFGFIRITWKIQNYFAATCKDNWVIRSPEIIVKGGDQVTKWRLFLESKLEEGKESVFTCLERLENNPNESDTDEIRVKWELSYPTGGIGGSTILYKRDFKRKDVSRSRIYEIDLLKNCMRTKNENTFTVRCRMIVYKKNGMGHITSGEAGFKSLSQDLSVMFKLKPFSDIVLIFMCDKTILAHKGVLSVRNPTLHFEFERGIGEALRIDISVEDEGEVAFKNLFNFLYSGNLNFLLRIPSFELLDLIENFNVRELKCYFAEDELNIRSEFGMQEFHFRWGIQNALSTKEHPLLSPCWRMGTLNTSFQLSLHLKENGKETDNIAVFGHFVGGPEPTELQMDCVIGIENRKEAYGLNIVWDSKSGNKLGFDNFIGRETLKTTFLSKYGTLVLFCNLRIRAGALKHSIVSSCTCFMENKTEKHYQKLSDDMGLLLRTGRHSDLTIGANMIKHKVHKAVLCCRSYVLKEIINSQREQNYISIPDIDPRAFRILLKYIYTGKLVIDSWRQQKPFQAVDISGLNLTEPSTSKGFEEQSLGGEYLDIVKSVYSASLRFSILSLQKTCTLILEENIGLQNVLEILILAQKSKNYKLKKSAIQFLLNNIEEIQRQKNWHDFISANSLLLTEIIECKESFYR